MSVIETPFGFLEVGKEGNGANAAQSGQTGFCVAPERLDAIDMAAPPGEFVGAVMNPVMFVAFENQAVVSAPSIGKDDAFVDRRGMSLNHLEEFSFRTIGQGGEQMTLPPLLRRPTTGIFLAAPRPRMPRTLLGPK
jgi:hypothetical protein